MKQIEKTLDSREVAEMVGKKHYNLMRDIKGYIGELGELKIEFTDFFRESAYRTEQNKVLPCYLITKKGCEFIAHKLTGTKGTEFTARYINRFHEMEDVIRETSVPVTAEPEQGLSVTDEYMFAYTRGIVLGVLRSELEEKSTMEILERLSARGRATVMKLIFGEVTPDEKCL